MNKVLLIIILSAFSLSGCGLLGFGESANTDANANAVGPDDPSAVPKFTDAVEAVKKGDEYLDLSLYKMAINAFRQATELDPDMAEAHFKLGVAYSLEEKETDSAPIGTEDKNSDKAFKNAVKVYKKFLKENPDDAEAHFNLGRAHAKLFEDKEAAGELEKAVKLSDENGLYRTEYGAALIKLARYNDAIKQLEKALEIDGDNIRAEDLLEKAKAGKKRLDFRPTPKDTGGSNTNANSNSETTPEGNTAPPPTSPGAPKKLPPPPPLPTRPPPAANKDS